MGLGQDSRPNDLFVLKGCSDGVTGVSLGHEGSDVMGVGVLFGKESFIIRPRAQSVSSISKEMGASGNVDPLVGMTRL